jgi:solute carrier family 35 protein E3
MAVNWLGFTVAMVSVAASGMQQILCGVVQRKHGVTSTQLLSNTAPVQVGRVLMRVF